MVFNKGKIPWNKGKKLSKEHKESLSKSHVGQIAWNKGLKGVQKRSLESRLKFSEYAKNNGFGKWLKGRSPYNKGKKGLYKWSEETREKYNLAIQDPEVKEKFRKHGIATMRKMIKKETSIEKILYDLLASLGLGFEKQVNVENVTLADAFLRRHNLVIFADGDYWHNFPNGTERDKRITKTLIDKNYLVLRFWENEIVNNLQYVKSVIKDAVETTREK